MSLSWTNKVDGVDTVAAADVNALAAEIIALETANQSISGQKTFTDGIDALALIANGTVGSFKTGIGPYAAMYYSAAYGARFLGFDGVNYYPVTLGTLVGSDFNLKLNTDGSSAFGGVVTGKRFNNQSLKNNYSTTAQVLSALTRTYLAGSALNFTAGSLQVGTKFRWVIDVTKTAAGTATSTFDICFGTSGTTSDTARVSFTKPAGTAAIDCGRIVIEAIIRGPLSSSGVAVGHFNMTHNLASTGLATIPCVDITTISSAFDVTTPTYVGICATTGASDAYTIQMVTAESWNL